MERTAGREVTKTEAILADILWEHATFDGDLPEATMRELSAPPPTVAAMWGHGFASARNSGRNWFSPRMPSPKSSTTSVPPVWDKSTKVAWDS